MNHPVVNRSCDTDTVWCFDIDAIWPSFKRLRSGDFRTTPPPPPTGCWGVKEIRLRSRTSTFCPPMTGRRRLSCPPPGGAASGRCRRPAPASRRNYFPKRSCAKRRSTKWRFGSETSRRVKPSEDRMSHDLWKSPLRCPPMTFNCIVLY